MAKKVVTKTTTEETQEQPAELEPVVDTSVLNFVPPVEESQEEQDLKAFFEGLGATDLVIKIFKFDMGSSKSRFCQDTDIEGATESAIQANWGGGRYLIRAFKEGRCLRSRTVYIADALTSKGATPAPAAPVVINPPAPDQSALAIQLEMMREEAKTNREIMLEMVRNMAGNQGAQKSSATELAEVMAILEKVKTPPQESFLDSIGKLMPVIQQFMKMASGQPIAEEDNSIGGIIKDVIKEAPNVLRMFAANKAAAAATPPALQPGNGVKVGMQPRPNPPAVAGASPVEGVTMEQLELARAGIQYLKGRARKKSDPNLYIDIFLDTLDEEQSMIIVRLLELPYEQFAQLDPEILTPVYRPWFEAFFGGLKDAIAEQNNADGSDGDTANPPSNEEPGPGGDPQRPANQGS